MIQSCELWTVRPEPVEGYGRAQTERKLIHHRAGSMIRFANQLLTDKP